MEGLVEAAERFDPGRGVAFGTYAYYRIRGAILDGLRSHDGRPRSTDTSGELRAQSGTNAYLADSLDTEPQRAEGSSHRPAVVLERLSSLLSGVAIVHLASLDAFGALHEAEALQPDEEAHKANLSERLRRAIAALPPREREVVERHYYVDQSFEEIGAELGICRAWACRLHARAVARLRETLADLTADTIR
jgi:RNA polymerase sigma factor for flagellar operon FliA